LPIFVTLKFYETPPSHQFNWIQIGYTFFATLIAAIAIWLVSHRLVSDRQSVGVVVQGILRSNFTVIGLYLIQAFYGLPGVSNATLLLVATIPLNNLISSGALGFYSRTAETEKRTHLILGLIKNPMILSLLLIPLIWFKPPVPQAILSAGHYISGMALPLALLSIGATIELKVLHMHTVVGAWSVIVRMVALPLLLIPGAILVGLRGIDLVSVFLYFAAPTATATYVTARAYKANAMLASWIIVVSSLVGLLTIPIGLTVLHLLGVV
ncbi:hypothetical protein EBR96_08700, partial [bacterium]|nr:hypothetical protein [bacterium]